MRASNRTVLHSTHSLAARWKCKRRIWAVQVRLDEAEKFFWVDNISMTVSHSTYRCHTLRPIILSRKGRIQEDYWKSGNRGQLHTICTPIRFEGQSPSMFWVRCFWFHPKSGPNQHSLVWFWYRHRTSRYCTFVPVRVTLCDPFVFQRGPRVSDATTNHFTDSARALGLDRAVYALVEYYVALIVKIQRHDRSCSRKAKNPGEYPVGHCLSIFRRHHDNKTTNLPRSRSQHIFNGH